MPLLGVQFVSSPKIHITPIVSVPFEENSYILAVNGRDDCIVVDPGLEPEKIMTFLDKKRLTPTALLNTHGHSDHIAGNAALKQRWPDARIVIGTHEAAMLTDPKLNLSAMFGLPIISPPADLTVCDGQTFEAAGLQIRVLEIPGHTPGHVVYLIEDHTPPWVLVGDVIFAGSVGRSDFPGGDFTQLATGIRAKLFTLPAETILWPGHGPSTTVGEEKASNPFVGEG